jgi:hypothetical protein
MRNPELPELFRVAELLSCLVELRVAFRAAISCSNRAYVKKTIRNENYTQFTTASLHRGEVCRTGVLKRLHALIERLF